MRELSDEEYWVPSYRRLMKDERLSPLDVHVHGYLAGWRMNDHSKPTFPSQKHIADCLGASAEGVRKSLKRLRDAGYVVVAERRRRPDGTRSTNRYIALLPGEWKATGSTVPVATGSNDPVVTGSNEPGIIRPVLQEDSPYGESSAGAEDDPLGSVKPPYRSVASQIHAMFKKASPSGRYKLTRKDGGVLKKLWEEVDDLHEIAKVIAAGGLRRSQDRFWAENWSPVFLLKNVSKLMNDSGTGGEVDERERIREAAWTSLERAASILGIEDHESRRVLREARFNPDEDDHVEHVRRLTAILDTPFWRQRILGSPTAERARLLRQAAFQYAPGGGSPSPAGPPTRGAASLFG